MNIESDEELQIKQEIKVVLFQLGQDLKEYAQGAEDEMLYQTIQQEWLGRDIFSEFPLSTWQNRMSYAKDRLGNRWPYNEGLNRLMDQE